jgi:peptide/nickel transport system ATP-binding protein
MYEGEIIEQSTKNLFFNNSQHDYSKRLIASFFNIENKLDLVKDFKKEKLLDVIKINKVFSSNNFLPFLFPKSEVRALNNVTFTIRKSKILGIVGESGSGKTTLARILMMLIPSDSGKIVFMSNELSINNNSEIRKLRKNMQIVFQNPLNSLNPILKIKKLMEEAVEINSPRFTIEDRNKKILELLNSVGLDEDILSRYPDQISGGEGQRIAIARALAIAPQLLILDESISSLDRIAQKEILNLLLKLKKQFDLSYILITHDLLVSRYFCDELLIMKKGEIIESGNTENIFKNPSNKYTIKLLEAIL